MRFELFVATRCLRAKRRQAFIGVITGISVLGVAAGVASLIVALAINNGFRQDLQARLLGSTAHISLLRVQSDGIREWRPLLEKLSKQPHVVAAAPAIYEHVLISRGPRARGAVLKGMVPKYIRFHVAGIFNSGFFDYDSSWAFIRLSDAQELFGLGDVISVIQFKLDDIYLAGDLARALEQAAGHGFMATSWMEQNKPLFRALRLERVVTFITIGLIVFVAALNILISLIMMVMEKTKDIAVLMSLWTKKAQIRRVFIAQGVLIALIATSIWLVRGYAISWAGGHYHFISLSAEVYSIDYLPFAPRLPDVVILALLS